MHVSEMGVHERYVCIGVVLMSLAVSGVGDGYRVNAGKKKIKL